MICHQRETLTTASSTGILVKPTETFQQHDGTSLGKTIGYIAPVILFGAFMEGSMFLRT